MIDNDRQGFEEFKRRASLEMGSDLAMQSQAREMLILADKHGWSYQWTWLGLPIIQLPTDIIAMQEIIWTSVPDLIIETGVARGGSVLLSASLLQLLGRGMVVGIDVDIRPQNRIAIESHPLGQRIQLIEGSSIDLQVVAAVTALAKDAERVMVILDSNHTHGHVLAELLAYSPLVSVGQYLIVCDTVVEDLPRQDHRPRQWGPSDNPATALAEFLIDNDDFRPDDDLHRKLLLTSSPGGYLRRVAGG